MIFIVNEIIVRHHAKKHLTHEVVSHIFNVSYTIHKHIYHSIHIAPYFAIKPHMVNLTHFSCWIH